MEKFTFELFRLEAELISNKKVCKNLDFCHTSLLKLLKSKNDEFMSNGFRQSIRSHSEIFS